MHPMMCSRARPAIAALLFLGMACADDVDPFESDDVLTGDTGGQLTFSVSQDRSPSWSSSGDSVYYSAEGFGHLPSDPGVLVGLPVNGGVSETILTNVQLEDDDEERWLLSPTVDPRGERLAYVEIVSLWEADLCPDTLLVCDPERARDEVLLPALRQLAIRVRRFDATGSVDDDPALELDAPGAFFTGFEATGFIVNDYPYQQLFDEERAFTFRASWAPDGQHLAFSDGLNVQIWNIEENTVTAVPNTEDGNWAAWNSDGEWIAFARLERADSSNVACLYIAFFPVCSQERTDYVPGAHILALIRPDGSDLTELGEGDEPAWSPNGNLIFFRRDDRIWSIRPDGSETTEVPGTQDGREPAVSPDGSKLAFARLNRAGDYDIWVIVLDTQ